MHTGVDTFSVRSVRLQNILQRVSTNFSCWSSAAAGLYKICTTPPTLACS